MVTAPHDDGRGYREAIAEMRDGHVTALCISLAALQRRRETGAYRPPGWYATWRKDARDSIRRIRALDHATFCMDELGRQLYLKFVAAQEREP